MPRKGSKWPKKYFDLPTPVGPGNGKYPCLVDTCEVQCGTPRALQKHCNEKHPHLWNDVPHVSGVTFSKPKEPEKPPTYMGIQRAAGAYQCLKRLVTKRTKKVETLVRPEIMYRHEPGYLATVPEDEIAVLGVVVAPRDRSLPVYGPRNLSETGFLKLEQWELQQLNQVERRRSTESMIAAGVTPQRFYEMCLQDDVRVVVDTLLNLVIADVDQPKYGNVSVQTVKEHEDVFYVNEDAINPGRKDDVVYERYGKVRRESAQAKRKIATCQLAWDELDEEKARKKKLQDDAEKEDREIFLEDKRREKREELAEAERIRKEKEDEEQRVAAENLQRIIDEEREEERVRERESERRRKITTTTIEVVYDSDEGENERLKKEAQREEEKKRGKDALDRKMALAKQLADEALEKYEKIGGKKKH